MSMKKIGSAIGVGALTVIGGMASCTSETGGGTSSTESASSSTATGSGSSGTGGAAATGTGSGGQSGAGQGGAGQGGSGGSMAYKNCSECTDPMSGAPANECKAAHDACFAVKECVGLNNCIFNGNPPCTNDQAGACCSLDCFTATAAPQAAIDLYKAMDSCVYCNACRALCSTDEYCAVFEPGGDSVCTP